MTIALRLMWLVVLAPGLAQAATRYEEVLKKIDVLKAQYPNLIHTFSIGTNDDGQSITGVRISTTPAQMDPYKIGHFMVSTHHGNESATPPFTLAFMAQLLERYGNDPKLADVEWTIVPVLNIPGYNANQRQEKGRDPNRDYPSPCTSHPGGKLKSVAALMDLLKTRIFSGSVTVHGYDGSITYPWGLYTSKTETQDHNFYDQIFRKAAVHNGYRVGTAADVVYPANGCYEDFVYWKYGLWSLLLELRDGSASDIRDTVQTIAAFYDELNATPSNKNQFLGGCTRSVGPDRRVE